MKRKMAALVDWEPIELAYEVWAETGDIDRAPSLEEARGVASHMREAGVHRDKRNPRAIIKWLTDRRAYSPYVDEVAVERVISTQDWDSAEDLTDREYSALLGRVVEIIDFQIKQPVIRPAYDVLWGTGVATASLWDLNDAYWAMERRSVRVLGSSVPSWGERTRVLFPNDHPVRSAAERRRERRNSAQAAAA